MTWHDLKQNLTLLTESNTPNKRSVDNRVKLIQIDWLNKMWEDRRYLIMPRLTNIHIDYTLFMVVLKHLSYYWYFIIQVPRDFSISEIYPDFMRWDLLHENLYGRVQDLHNRRELITFSWDITSICILHGTTKQIAMKSQPNCFEVVSLLLSLWYVLIVVVFCSPYYCDEFSWWFLAWAVTLQSVAAL